MLFVKEAAHSSSVHVEGIETTGAIDVARQKRDERTTVSQAIRQEHNFVKHLRKMQIVSVYVSRLDMTQRDAQLSTPRSCSRLFDKVKAMKAECFK